MNGITTIKQRAVSEEQQALRREQILEAAAAALGDLMLEDITLAQIAKDVGITKPALYRYWRGKEQIFLSLFEREFKTLVVHFETEPVPPIDKAREIADMFLAHPLFCRLYAITGPVLLKRVNIVESLAFNSVMRDLMERLLLVISDWLNHPCDEELRAVVKQVMQGLIGVWAMAQSSTTHDEVLSRPDMAVLRVDMARDFRALVGRLLNDFCGEGGCTEPADIAAKTPVTQA